MNVQAWFQTRAEKKCARKGHKLQLVSQHGYKLGGFFDAAATKLVRVKHVCVRCSKYETAWTEHEKYPINELTLPSATMSTLWREGRVWLK